MLLLLNSVFINDVSTYYDVQESLCVTAYSKIYECSHYLLQCTKMLLLLTKVFMKAVTADYNVHECRHCLLLCS